ncbi:hypothetical protein UT300009_03940 [Paraclostridium bifermentans]
MGSFIIIVVTIFSIGILLIRNRKINKRLKTSILKSIKEINHAYRDLFTDKSILIRIIQAILILIAELTSFITIYAGIIKYLHINLYYGKIEWIIKLWLAIVCLIIVHYAIGYILALSLKIQNFIHNVEHKNLKVDFILSYFMISSYLTVVLIFPKEFTNNIYVGLIGMIVCYYLNIKTLITLIANPANIKSIKKEDNGYSRIIIASILILIMLIINLYLIVCLVNGLEQGAFLNANNKFDLFYYTVITFTTIGYGDIIPVTVLAKITSMLISVTSVVCLSVFLSSMLSYKDELSKD